MWFLWMIYERPIEHISKEKTQNSNISVCLDRFMFWTAYLLKNKVKINFKKIRESNKLFS